ncbi:MAG: hypothetical protein ACLSEX_08015 [Blautia sp.]
MSKELRERGVFGVDEVDITDAWNINRRRKGGLQCENIQAETS